MKTGFAALFLSVCILGNGCAYLNHRGKDFADVITIAVEEKTAGLTVSIFAPLGASRSDGTGWGLRDGHFGSYHHRDNALGIILLVGGLYSYDVCFEPPNDYRHKGYSFVGSSKDPDELSDTYRVSRMFNLQASVGIYYGLRMGLNLAEAFDFLIGWTTLDPMGDDIQGGASEGASQDAVTGCPKGEQVK